MSIKRIEQYIEDLRNGASIDDLELLGVLSYQLICASSHRQTITDLRDDIQQEDDILSGYDQDTYFFEQVREIQTEIIYHFGCDDEICVYRINGFDSERDFQKWILE